VRRALRALPAGVALLGLLSGCAGSSCDDLPQLREERDRARADYLELARSGATAEQTGAADDALHELERRVYDAEQRCG
jgi:hypothetical protein